ncbi:hypothetical protein MRX96_025111 [Rhipicephalus microplus]
MWLLLRCFSGPFDVAHGSPNADSAVDSPALTTAKRTGTGGHLSEDYQQDSYSDEVSRVSVLRFYRVSGGVCCGLMFCLGSSPAEERLVHVSLLRPQDASTHAKRIRMASELSKLRSNGKNRTSAFFVDARTSIVHDKFPKGLWDALSCYREGQASKDTASAKDLQHPGYYLVTEIQSGWRPLSTHKVRAGVCGDHTHIISANGTVEYTDLSHHRQPIVDKKVFDKIADTLGIFADRFKPRTNAMWLKHLAKWLTRQNDAGTSATLKQWKDVLSVGASAEDAAEEATDTTTRHPTSRRPAPPLCPRRKKPKLD